MVTLQHLEVKSNLTEKDINAWFNEIAQIEGVILGDIAVVLGSDKWLLDYNRRYLNHDYYTDIITFDYVEQNIISGDLLISVDTVFSNAIDQNVPRETELKRVVIHGFLHLCGYNDKSPSEVELMRKKEDFYLNLL